MGSQTYPSDSNDAQWSSIEPHMPVHPGGRPRKTKLRQVVNAIFYILRSGCQWRYLPKDFPPRSTVWRYFDPEVLESKEATREMRKVNP